MRERFPIGSIAQIYFDLIVAGAGVTGQAPVIAIERGADGLWWNAATSLFQTAYVENPMAELDAINWPGRYVFEFDHAKDDLVSTVFLIKMANGGTPPTLVHGELAFGPLAAVARPGLCSIRGGLFEVGGEPLQGALVQATLVPVFTDSFGRGFEAAVIKRVYTGAGGWFELPFVQGATVRLEIPAIGYDRRATVPSQPDVLFTAL
jgi:hypothetical protein